MDLKALCLQRKRRLTKTLLIMKFTAIILLSACLTASANGFSQQITLSGKNLPLSQVFKEIQKQSGYQFLCTQEIIKEAGTVTIELRNVSLQEAVVACLKGKGLTYEIIDRTVVIKKQPEEVKKEETLLPPINVKGRIVDNEGKPVVGASVQVKGNKSKGTTTNENGEFALIAVDENSVLVISGVNIESFEVQVNGRSDLAVLGAKLKVTALGDIQVLAYNTGYEKVSRDRANGSFVHVDSNLFNRATGSNVLQRLEGVVSGVLFNRSGTVGNDPAISIRGRSTIFGNPDPLIILDNFPYTGSLDNINPNDIESIDVLKDASAASIWGAFSANGVIVINTKTGKLNSRPRVSMNSNITIGEVPNQFSAPQLSSQDFIEMEKFLFAKGFYNNNLTSSPQSAQSPVIDILEKVRNNMLSQQDADILINQLALRDVRNDLKDHFYNPSLVQQYSINVKGGSQNNTYFLSVGYDKNQQNLKINNDQRITLNIGNNLYFFDKKLEVSNSIQYTNSRSQSGQVYNPKYPYERLVDEAGNPLPVIKDYRQSYIDTIGNGKLLDWRYFPLNDFSPTYFLNLNDIRVNAGLKYNITKYLSVGAYYQYSNGSHESNQQYKSESYYTRNLINQYSQIDYSTGVVNRIIKEGDIINNAKGGYDNHYFRTILNYSKTFNDKHSLSSLIGYEVKDNLKIEDFITHYGYSPSTATYQQINPDIVYNLLPLEFRSTGRLNNNSSKDIAQDRFVSYFFNAGYIYDSKYSLTASARKDESNLFGVETNMRGVPLWSVGAGWTISRESFFRSSLFPFLKLRATYGYNGNIDKSVSAYVTTRVSSSTSSFGLPYLALVNPPNPNLRWEKVGVLNLGIDFSLKKNVVNGSFEYFIKKGTDLIGLSPLAPQTGTTQYRGNTANIETKGFDLTLRGNFSFNQVKWQPTLLISHSKEIVSKYLVKQNTIVGYLLSNYLNPLEGYPYNSVFGYKFLGLDTLGRPIGILDGNPSINYSAIQNSNNLNSLQYFGSGTPTWFGSFRNDFTVKKLTLSFNILFKAGYYQRISSIRYNSLSSGNYRQRDFDKRWQNPGDEKFTTVPAFIYPLSGARDEFYNNSSANIYRADHIRFQDIRVSYEFDKIKLGTYRLPSILLYGMVNNIGILWKSNNLSIDPESTNFRKPRTFVLGVTANF